MEVLVTIPIHPTDWFRTTKLGSLFQDKWKTELEKFLKENLNVFAWLYDEMPGIEPEVMVHRLNVDPNYKQVQQKGVCSPLKDMKLKESRWKSLSRLD